MNAPFIFILRNARAKCKHESVCFVFGITQFKFPSSDTHVSPARWKRCTKQTQLHICILLPDLCWAFCQHSLPSTHCWGRKWKEKKLGVALSFPFLLCHRLQHKWFVNTGKEHEEGRPIGFLGHTCFLERCDLLSEFAHFPLITRVFPRPSDFTYDESSTIKLRILAWAEHETKHGAFWAQSLVPLRRWQAQEGDPSASNSCYIFSLLVLIPLISFVISL